MDVEDIFLELKLAHGTTENYSAGSNDKEINLKEQRIQNFCGDSSRRLGE